MIIDTNLFNDFKNGSEKALEKIFRIYFKTLVSFSVSHGLDEMEGEDIVIDIFHNIWDIRGNIPTPSALNSLLYTSVKHKSMNVYRDVSNRKRILEEQFIQDEGEDPAENAMLMEEEVSRFLYDAIQQLPEQCRKVMELLLTGKKANEIAGILEISPSSVKTYKTRSIEILKERFQAKPALLCLLVLLSRLD